MNGITLTQDCLVGASNFLLKFWCSNFDLIFQTGVGLLIVLFAVSVVLGFKKGWKWGATLFLIGGGLMVLAGILIQAAVHAVIWG